MTNRFTLDGSDALEGELCKLTQDALAGVRALIPKHRLQGLVLGGGYGRGEGGVLNTKHGHRPYNDLEFFVFLRGSTWLNERKYRDPLHHLGEELSVKAGIEVEFKILSLEKFRASPVSMFYYDLISGHKIVTDDETLLSDCEHHRAAHRIPLYECSRLLMNRCSGLLFALDRLQRNPFSAGDSDFVGRNIAKAQLAFGDVLLAACGQYHWSCRERHRRLPKLREEINAPWVEQICEEHTEGLLFKLHPQAADEPACNFVERHARLSELGRKLWLWLESRRLNSKFPNVRAYAFAPQKKCPEVHSIKARAISARAFGISSLVQRGSHRYPRERLLNALPLLLWDSEATREPAVAQFIQKQLRTSSIDYHEWVLAYQRIWGRFN
ncbi:MAG: hypothetical protein JWM99_1656 [Verrucomicrobiales bacterium]|nr:hypothetical protein [Verrucomicrobiales bacterium]